MKIFLISLLLGSSAFAAAPTINANPQVQYLLKNDMLIKWRTADAPGPSSTITCNLSQLSTGASSVCPVAAATGSSFPPGSVVNVGHEHMLVQAQMGDTLTLSRGYDPDFERVWENTLLNITVDSLGTTCTVNTIEKHFYVIGDTFSILREVPTNIPYPGGVSWVVASVPTTTSFTFACVGTANSTTNNAGLQVYKYSSTHSSGDVIQRVDAPSQVCYGTTTAYSAPGSPVLSPESTFTALKQSINHFVYVVGLTPGTLYHWKIQSATGGGAAIGTCASPGADTVQSSDATSTTVAAVANDQIPVAPSNNGRTWDFTDVASFTTDILAANDCSNLQTLVNNATGVSSNGNLNYRIRIPTVANCSINLILPKKGGTNTAGTGKLVLEVDSVNLAKLPPQGVRLNTTWQGSLLPTLYTSTSSPAIFIAPSASYWIVRGLHVMADPSKNSAFFGGDTPIISSFDGSNNDYDIAVQPTHIAFDQIWSECRPYINYCKGPHLHGTYIAVMDSVVQAYGINQDQGGIQYDGFASQYLYVHNNFVTAPMSGYYQSDNSIHVKDNILDRNTFFKPPSMSTKSSEFLFSTVQSVSAAVAGGTTTLMTTTQNDIGQGFTGSATPPVAISGAVGNWAPLNYNTWAVRNQTVTLNCTSSFCTAVTSTPHNMTTGQFVYIGGGYQFPCNNFYSYLSPTPVTVSNSTTFTFAEGQGSDTFSTTSGSACNSSDLIVYGPVFKATFVDTSTFTIPVNSTGFGALTGTVTVGYPEIRDVKNGFEFKNGEKALITGNIIDGVPAVNQSGQGIAMTVRGPDMFNGWPMANTTNCFLCGQTIVDVNISQNWIKNACTGLEILGLNPNGPTTPAYRIQMQNNLTSNISATAGNGSTCLGTLFHGSYAYNDVTFDHNTSFNSLNVLSEGSPYLTAGKLYFTNNMVDSAYGPGNGSCFYGGMLSGLNLNSCLATYSDWLFSRNVQYGDLTAANSADPWAFGRQYADGITTGSQAFYQAQFWPQDQGGVGFVGQITFNACTNTAPVVCTSTAPHGLTANQGYLRVMGATGNTGANGLWPIGLVTASTVTLGGSIGNGSFSGTANAISWNGPQMVPANAALTGSSSYIAGTTYVPATCCPPDTSAGAGAGTDNLDIGAGMPGLRTALGDLTFTSVAPTTTSALFAYIDYAGTGETCYIDTSNDNFVTFVRTTDNGTGTSRSTNVTGLTGGNTYGYRLQCPTNSASGTFFTGAVGAVVTGVILQVPQVVSGAFRIQ